MRKYQISLYQKTKTEDALGNMVETGQRLLKQSWCRMTLYGAEEQDRLTHDVQLIECPLPYKTVRKADFCTVDGVRYKITDVVNASPRWTVIKGEVWRS